MEQKRIKRRRPVLKTGFIEFADGVVECTVRNMSEVGAALEVSTPLLYIPDRFTLFIPSEQSKRTCRTAWRKGSRMGVAFE
jgi:hypothetical protein